MTFSAPITAMRRGGRRSGSARAKSMTSFRGTSSRSGPAFSNPIPRASISAGALAGRRNRPSASHTPSSQISSAPKAINSSANDDLPLPDGPRINTPAPSSATALAWKNTCAPSVAVTHWASGSGGGSVTDQIGRPTTNRAPEGSDVTSASVGRIFSAQITPPWASTICLEIARPRPELLPNWCTGRSE